MHIGNWYRKRAARLAKGPRRKTSQNTRQLRVESLEDRRLLAVFVVNNAGDIDDDGNALPGTLRQAVELANATPATDTIIFSENDLPFGASITLQLNENGGGELEVLEPLRILGPGPDKLTVRAAGGHRIFNLNVREEDAAFPVFIGGMTMTGGSISGAEDTDAGGAIFNRERLTLEEVVMAGNFASQGGGALYNAFGTVSIDRSLFINNSTGLGGGALLNGPEADMFEGPLSIAIQNSTISGNTASGDGGGVLNRIGFVTIHNSTIRENTGYYGAGVGSQGNPVGEDGEDPPPPVVFTYIGNSIIDANTVTSDAGTDVDSIGMTDDEEPIPLETSVTSEGFNIIGTLGPTIARVTTDMLGVDPLLSDLGRFGGVTDVYYPQSNPNLGPVSPAIDGGDPGFADPFNRFEQRGRHFTRVSGSAVDIGAVEVQPGSFVVDSLEDEIDGQTSLVVDIFSEVFPAQIGQIGYDLPGDFALREAILFSEQNPEVDTITFATSLLNEDDPTASDATTILLTGFAAPDSGLRITQPVSIIGPIGFELEIDASGLDPTPSQSNFDGGRAFLLDDGDFFNAQEINISNLTILGGDVIDTGGAILNREALTISSSTIKDSAASFSGGGIFSQFGTLVVESTLLTDNFAPTNGGGIYIESGIGGQITTAVVRNSTISGNLAGDKGGGLYNANGEVLIEFSTITDNDAGSTRGSGVASLPGPDALTQLRSSIVAGNSGNDIEFLNGAVNIQSLGFNLVGDGNAAVVFNQPGDQTFVVDPMLAPLSVNGGLRPTHRLLPGSPAVDAGDPTAVPSVGDVPTFDQRGTPFGRVFDGDLDTKARIDIGAYELQPTTFIVDNPLDENDGDTSLGNLSLREAIAIANVNPLADTITFAPVLLGTSISPSPFFLQPGTPIEMFITDSLTIEGLGEFGLTIDGSSAFDGTFNLSRLFVIDDGDANEQIDVTINNMRIQDFTSVEDVGGAIKSSENLHLERVTFVNNRTLGDSYHGGAIYIKGADLSLNDVTLTGSRTDGANADGGAIYIRDGNLSITNNSAVTGNTVAKTLGNGGGIFIQNGNLDIAFSTVTGNTAPGGQADGGGIFADQAVVTIADSTISGNSMTGSNSEGAGIHARNSQVVISDTAITTNSTTGTQSEGAALYLFNGSATIDNTLFSLNRTSGNFSVGAAIASVNSSVTITGSTFNGNTTTGGSASGAALHNLNGDLTLIDSTVADNSVSGANAKGGGIYTTATLGSDDGLVIRNSTVSGNSTADRGGGIYNAQGSTRIEYSTITDNENTAQIFGLGGGVASFGSTNTQTVVRSSIIAGNRGSDVDQVNGAFSNSFDSDGYNVVGNGLAIGAFNQPGDQTGVADPMLAPLAFNGGPTRTHKPFEGSAAVNAGDPAAIAGVGQTPLFDQRGDFDQVQGLSRVRGGQIDVGAYETSFSNLAADFNGDGRVSGIDFLRWQRGFGQLGATKATGDADNNGVVNGADLAIFEQTFGDSVDAVAAASGPAEIQSSSTEAPLAGNQWITAPETRRGGRPANRGALAEPTAETALRDKLLRSYGDGRPAAAASSSDAAAELATRRSERPTHRPAVVDLVFGMLGS